LIKLKDAIIITAPSADEDKEEGEDDKSKPPDRRVQLEAARVLAMLCEDSDKRDAIIAGEGLGLLCFLLESPFDILHIEATRALTLLAESESGRHAIITTILEPLISLISSAESVKARFATLHLLSLLAVDPKCKGTLQQTSLCELLNALTKGEKEQDKEILQIANHLISLLTITTD